MDADLAGADLESANLKGADLTRANLFDAKLAGADLSAAHLNGANLASANLDGATLESADLEDADFANAQFENAYLEDADLKNAHLENADLSGAYLDGVNFANAHLAGANLQYTDLAGANFDLLPDSLPDALKISDAKDLQLVKFSQEPAGLVKLRSQFKDLGLHAQESQLTYAIRRSELVRVKFDGTPLHGRIEQCLNYVLFDLTCQYGMSPGMPVVIVARLAVLFSVFYIFAQIFPGRRSGIWVVWEEHRTDKTEGGDAPQRLTGGFPSARPQARIRFLSIALLALYFSLLSALRIGWSGLNLGTWISRMQPREYELRATGWVRFVSGLQSLLSVYLVALTILTYFGTPFEY